MGDHAQRQADQRRVTATKAVQRGGRTSGRDVPAALPTARDDDVMWHSQQTRAMYGLRLTGDKGDTNARIRT